MNLNQQTQWVQVAKDRKPSYYPSPNSAEETTFTPPTSAKKITFCQGLVNNSLMSKGYASNLDDGYNWVNPKRDFEVSSSKSVQYPFCQECKIHESRFVCAGCGNQWYCSKMCQISAWDKHSEVCTD